MRAQLFWNGNILTMENDDCQNHQPDAVATYDGQIIAVGALQDCKSVLEGSISYKEAYETINLKGQTLLPGFIDTHLHPVPIVFFAMNANLEKVTTIAEFATVLRPYVDKAEGEEWVVGLQFPPNNLTDVQVVTRKELDQISPTRPLIIYMRDGHSIIANSSALEKAGINNEVSTPDGGTIERDKQGNINGIFRETAVALVLEYMPLPDVVKMQAAVKACFHQLVKQGITSIGAIMQSDGEGPGGESAKVESLAMQFLNMQIPQSLYCIIIGKTLEGINVAANSNLNDKKKNVTRAFKIFSDGTFGSCTACMSEPYQDAPSKKGYMTIKENDLYARMVAAHTADYQICIHAIGDKSIIECLNLYERLLQEYPKEDHRHRLEHASIANETTIKKMANLGIVVSAQPLFIRSEHEWLTERLGEERCRYTYPFRSFLDHGVKLAGSSDAPIESTDVIDAIHCCVTRDGFSTNQCISTFEALKMYTIDAAYAQFQEQEKGSIAVGKKADLVVLDKSPMEVPVEEIPNIQVMRTIIDGTTLYEMK